jgi:hypothetical protein
MDIAPAVLIARHPKRGINYKRCMVLVFLILNIYRNNKAAVVRFAASLVFLVEILPSIIATQRIEFVDYCV